MIEHIQNGELGSSVKDKLNLIIDEVNSGYTFGTGGTSGSSGVAGTDGTSGSSGDSGSSGSSGTSGILPEIGNNTGILFRETGATYGYNTDTGFTFDIGKSYLRLGSENSAGARIHVYGDTPGDYLDESNISSDSAILIDGGTFSDKSLILGEGGVDKWAFQTYRQENGDFLYIYNPQVNNLSTVYSRSGRVGVNKQSNVANYHTQYLGDVNGALNDLEISGWFDRLYQLLYQIQISVVGNPDQFHWRKSRNNGLSWSDWSSNIPVNTGITDLEFNITLFFDNSTGHNLYDGWMFTAFPQLPQGTFTVAANGYSEILLTDDYTQPIPTHKDVTNGLSTTYSGFETCLSGLTSAIFVGWKLPFNSIYFNTGENAVGVTLKIEYYSSSGWTEISTTEGLGTLIDFTNNLAGEGKVEWDRQELDWISYQLLPGEGTDYDLYWVRVTTTTIPSTPPVIDSLSLGGTVRLGVYSSFLDTSPSFYVDGSGRVILGDYNHSLLGGEYIKNGYLGVNVKEPSDMVHVYGLDNVADWMEIRVLFSPIMVFISGRIMCIEMNRENLNIVGIMFPKRI